MLEITRSSFRKGSPLVHSPEKRRLDPRYRMTSASILLVGLLLGVFINNVSGQCSGSTLTLTASGLPQFVTTPNYPSNYPSNSDCSWLITNNNSTSVIFNIEDIDTESCSYDFIELYDGSSTGATKLGKFCSSGDHFFISSGTSFYMTFESDGSVTYSGVSALYFISDDALKPPCNTTLTNATSQTQYIMSSSLPNAYPTNDYCWFIIYASTQYYGIAFDIIFMDIESDCSKDKLTIAGVYQGTPTEVLAGCVEAKDYHTTYAEPVESVGDYALVTFTSDGTDSGHKGFYLSYTEVFKGIEMTYPSENGTLVLTATESLTGTINATGGFITLNFTGTLQHNFTEVNGVQYFALTADTSVTGRYTVDLSTAVDYETIKELSTLLSLKSTDVPQRTLYVTINVTITDEDDNAPTFLNLPDNVTLLRGDVAGLNIFQVITNDSDVTDDFKNVRYSIASSEDSYGLLSIDNATGDITLANDVSIMPTSVTEYIVGITATSTVGDLDTVEYLTIILPPDQPPNCSHVEIFSDPLDTNTHEAYMDIEYDEPWSCTDEYEITYSIGSVSPTLARPLFDIDPQYGDLWIVRRYTEDELDVTLRFEVEIVATDTESQTTSILVIVNTTLFGCYPNPQVINARMGDPPGTILKTDFNCTVQTGLFFSIKKQYPSNAFQMVTYPDGSYAVTLLDEVYKIRFYSLILRVSNGVDRIKLKFQVVIQTNVCTAEEVSTNG